MSNIDVQSLSGFLEFAQEANTRSTLAVEDGLKPVHRRILFSMGEDKAFSNKPELGSPKIVGNVLGNYHPHGDTAVYDAAIRMSQDFKMRYPLIQVRGNSGKIVEPENFAAMRYTQMRLTPLGEMMLSDIEKDAVDMISNYNETCEEPVVLTSTLPNLLLNGGMGIGVGISSSLVPHNLNEICDGIIAYTKNPRITVEELMNHIQGPDFPTGGVITDAFSLPAIYESGKGTIKLRAKYHIATIAGKTTIVITEIPYLISAESRIIVPIQELVAEEGYDQIDDIQNCSGNHGLELRIILEKNANVNSVLQKLFEKTALEVTIKINQTVMLKDGTFVTLGLRGLIAQYLGHQHDVLIRTSQYDINKAQARLHIVNGLIIAARNIDEVVTLIKGSSNSAEAKVKLISKFEFDEIQAQAVLELRLSRLTSLEIDKLLKEKGEIEVKIIALQEIVNSNTKRTSIIVNFLSNLKSKYGDSRRTMISEMKIIEKGEHVYLSVNSGNQFTTTTKDEITAKGKKVAAKSKVIDILYCNTKDTIMLLDDEGKIYSYPVNELLDGKATFDSQIIKLMPIEEKDFFIFITKDGLAKKTPWFSFKRSSQGTKLKEGDKMFTMLFANDSDYLMVLGSEGRCMNIPVSDLNSLGKLTYGSKVIATKEVLAATVCSKDDLLLTITSDNKAKLTEHSDFIINSKGASGSIITEDCINLINTKTYTELTIFGEDNKPSILAVNTLAIKSRNSIGAKIYNYKIDKIVTL